jgi:hypothetical protein
MQKHLFEVEIAKSEILQLDNDYIKMEVSQLQLDESQNTQ